MGRENKFLEVDIKENPLVASSVFTNLNLKTVLRLTVYTCIWKNTQRPHGCYIIFSLHWK